MSEEYRIFFSFIYFHRRNDEYLWCSVWFFFAEYQIVISIFLLLVFFCSLLLICIFVLDHRHEGRTTVNRLCHSDISKMIFHNVFIRFIFVLIFIHTARTQTSEETSSTGKFVQHIRWMECEFFFFDSLWILWDRCFTFISLYYFVRLAIFRLMIWDKCKCPQ